MALIKCSECGREISDKAAACPFCGCPVHLINNNSYTVVLEVQVIGMLLGAFINTAVSAVTQAITDEIQKRVVQ